MHRQTHTGSHTQSRTDMFNINGYWNAQLSALPPGLHLDLPAFQPRLSSFTFKTLALACILSPLRICCHLVCHMTWPLFLVSHELCSHITSQQGSPLLSWVLSCLSQALRREKKASLRQQGTHDQAMCLPQGTVGEVRKTHQNQSCKQSDRKMSK